MPRGVGMRCLGTHLPAATEWRRGRARGCVRRRAGSPVEASCSLHIGQLVAFNGSGSLASPKTDR